MLDEIGTSHTHLYTRDDEGWAFLVELTWGSLSAETRAALFPLGPPLWTGAGLLTERGPDGTGWFARGVLDGSPAAAAGVRTGDRLIAIEDEFFSPVVSFRPRIGRRTR